jgi:uncharacterized protein YndB with AHSA1/START domain
MTAKERSTIDPPLGIEKTVELNVPAKAVFEAVSTPQGLRRWWSENLTGSANPGDELRLEFVGGAHEARIRLESAREPALAKWHVVQHRPLNEWDGTALVFSISPWGAEKSELEFRYAGRGPQCDCYEACVGGWDHYLGSLKQYAELGKVTPA